MAAQEMTAEQKKAYEDKLKNMSPEEIQDMIRKQCIFCKIAANESPSYKVYEDDKVIAFLDIKPINKGHVLVVPKSHYSLLTQVPDDLVAHLFTVAKKISPIVFEMMDASGILILQSNGSSAGQVIPHIHIHIVPTYDKEQYTDFKDRLDNVEKKDFEKINVALSEGIKKIYGKSLFEKPAEKKEIENPKKEEVPDIKTFKRYVRTRNFKG